MKLSLKFQGHDDHQPTTQLMTAKVPITIFNHSFISAITASTTNNNTPSDFSFSLSSNFPSGPSLKLSYSPTTTTTTTSFPFSLSLKSGLGIFGSPRHSPLVFSANFSLSSTYTPIPTFFLHFKPQFGHFSLNKTVFSDTNTEIVSASLTNGESETPSTAALNSIDKDGHIGKGFAGDGSSSGWQELKLEPCGGKNLSHAVDNRDGGDDSSVGGAVGFVPERPVIGKSNIEKRGISPRVALMARTLMPVTKGFLLNLRWGVNFPRESAVKMPYLTVNKIGLEKVEEVKPNKKGRTDPSESDLQLMKGMCFWMKRDLENVKKENMELKRMLDEMKMGVSTRNYREGNNGGGVGKKLSQQHSGSKSSSEFERWRSKKSGRGEENEKKEPKNPHSLASDVESELQKAIKAASS